MPMIPFTDTAVQTITFWECSGHAYHCSGISVSEIVNFICSQNNPGKNQPHLWPLFSHHIIPHRLLLWACHSESFLFDAHFKLLLFGDIGSCTKKCEACSSTLCEHWIIFIRIIGLLFGWISSDFAEWLQKLSRHFPEQLQISWDKNFSLDY